MNLPIVGIRLDCGTQSRASLNQDTINQYAEDMTEGAVFPPPVVFYNGEDHILSVGFHRVHAALQAGYSEMECEVRNGTLRDAILFSIKSNADHGLPRTNADKKHAVKMAFQQLMEDGRNIRDVDDVSHTEVARMAAVHHTFIMKIRVDIADELLGKCDNHTTPTIQPKSKGKSYSGTMILLDDMGQTRIPIENAGEVIQRLKAEKEALAEKQRHEIEARARAEGDLISVKNQLEFLRNKAKAERPEPERVEVIPPDIEDELQSLRLENSRIAAALEEAKKPQAPVTMPEPKVVEKEVFVTPPAVENELKRLRKQYEEEQSYEKKKARLQSELDTLRAEGDNERAKNTFLSLLDYIHGTRSATERIKAMAKAGTLTVEHLDESERLFMAMVAAGNDGMNTVREARGLNAEGAGLRVIK
ncbi:MAG: hypothetical protein EOM03_15275 [Clostridia bacterium]|nr:hypothetical protein [Clostridia bacterium]